MPTLADIYSAIDTAKRKAGNFVRQPVSSLQEMLALANDEARQINRQTALSAQGARQELRGQPMTAEQAAADQDLQQRLINEMSLGGMTVWHGSPYKFTKFDVNKIGSGEGNQVYGHGLYFAEAPAVAEGYKNRLTHRNFSRIIQKDRNVYDVVAPDGTIIVENVMHGPAQKAREAFNAQQKGNLYKIDLPDERIAEMIDWDKPVPEEIRQKLSKVMMERFGSGATGTSGEKLYKEIQQEFKMAGSKTPAQDASMFLKEQGIPGIKYLDADSYSASLRNPSKKGTSNFVVFDPAHLKILERNNGTN